MRLTYVHEKQEIEFSTLPSAWQEEEELLQELL